MKNRFHFDGIRAIHRIAWVFAGLFQLQCAVFADIILAPFRSHIQGAQLVVEASKLFLPTGSSLSTVYAVVDREGKFLAPFSPSWRAPYSEGLGAAGECDEKGEKCQYGYMDPDLKWVIPPRFPLRPGRFQEGLAVYPEFDYQALSKDGVSYTNRKGERVIPGWQILYGHGFRFGYARVALKAMGKDAKGEPLYGWGWMDAKGNILEFEEPGLPKRDRFQERIHIREGMVPCPRRDESGKLLWGFRNLQGDWVVEPKYHSVSPFYFGKAIVQTEESIGMTIQAEYNLIDAKGKIIYPEESFFEIHEPNHRGLGAIRVVPPLGERNSRSFLFHWKTGERSKEQVSVSYPSNASTFWDQDLVIGTVYSQHPNGKTYGQSRIFNEKMQVVVDRAEKKYVFNPVMESGISDGAVLVRFYDLEVLAEKGGAEEMVGFMDMSGDVFLTIDQKDLKKWRTSDMEFHSGRWVLRVIK